MKLREVQFDRYAGREGARRFTDKTHRIELDPALKLITITPIGGGEALLLVASNCDMYPAEEPVNEGPARPLPAKSRSRA